MCFEHSLHDHLTNLKELLFMSENKNQNRQNQENRNNQEQNRKNKNVEIANEFLDLNARDDNNPKKSNRKEKRKK